MKQNDLKLLKFYRWRQANIPTTAVRKNYVQKYQEDVFFMLGIDTFFEGVYKCKGIELESIENSSKKVGTETHWDFYYGPHPILKIEYDITELKFSDLSQFTKIHFWNWVFGEKNHLILNLKNNFSYYKGLPNARF